MTARNLDQRVDERRAHPERLLPRVEKEPAQPELERPLELGDRGLTEVRIDPRKARQPIGMRPDGRGHRVVRRPQVIPAGLRGDDDRPVDAGVVHRREQLLGGGIAAEQRFADVRERVDDYRTASRMRRAFSPSTRRSDSASRPASLTFSTSMRGEQTGPSDA